MTTLEAQNKALVRYFTELANGRELEGAFACFAPNFVDHAASPGMPSGVQGTRMFFDMLFHAFPDLHATIEDLVAEGDRVVDRMTCEGTHQGPFMGAAPTGRHVKWSWIDIHRIVEGKVVEHWSEADTMGLLQQLGLVPPPLWR